MRVKKETDLLDVQIRKRIIEEIQSRENQERKDEAFKRYECMKDLVNRWVVKELLKQFDAATVEEMSYAISNISITKKIIGKLARVYNNGVKRTVPDKKEPGVIKKVISKITGSKPTETSDLTKQIEEIADYLEMNSKMKKVNKYVKLQMQCAVFVKPIPDQDDENLYQLKLEIMQPYLYDVVEQYHDREKAMAYVLSHYSPTGSGANSLVATNVARAGRMYLTPTIKPEGDGQDQLIANSQTDKDIDKKEYIWWSKNYHFTTDAKGEIIKSDIGDNPDSGNNENPIGILPIKEFVRDQDGTFWSAGGNDLVSGDILINCMITNLNHIGVTQGYGQFFMKGKNLPKQIKLGPNKAITMEVDSKEDPDPSIGFATANPPLDELMRSVEMYVALLLTTNNLTTTGLATKLDSFKNAASGVALIIDKAESIEDVVDQQQIFIDGEPEVFEIISAWLNYYGPRNQLCEDLVPYKGLPADIDVNLKFGDAQPIMSETEKLNNIAMREKLGINTAVELIMKDDPSLTEQEAEEKLTKLLEDKIKNAAFWQSLQPVTPQPGDNSVDGGGNPAKQTDNVDAQKNGADNANGNQSN